MSGVPRSFFREMLGSTADREVKVSRAFASCFQESQAFQRAVLQVVFRACRLKPSPRSMQWRCETEVHTSAPPRCPVEDDSPNCLETGELSPRIRRPSASISVESGWIWGYRSRKWQHNSARTNRAFRAGSWHIENRVSPICPPLSAGLGLTLGRRLIASASGCADFAPPEAYRKRKWRIGCKSTRAPSQLGTRGASSLSSALGGAQSPDRLR